MNSYKHHITTFICMIIPVLLLSFIPSSNNEYTVAICANAVAAGDLDQDGNTDIVTTNIIYSQPEWTGFSFLMNQGGCNFSFTDSVYHYWIREFLKIENLDTDPHPELIFAKGRNIEIIFNNNFNDTLVLNTASNYIVGGVAFGDLDNNGFKDILYFSNQDKRWGYFSNNGNKTFSNTHLFNTIGYYPAYISCGDLNSDGREDVVVTGYNTEIYYNLISGFQKVILKDSNYMNYLKVIDLDGDGKVDIFSLDREIFPMTTFIIYQNKGNGVFDTILPVTLPFSTYSCDILDLNCDTLPDLICLLYPWSGYKIYYNLGNFQFGNPQYVAVPFYGEYERNFYCGDIDGNHCPDIVTSRRLDSKIPNINILYNDGHGNFTPSPYVGIKQIKTSETQDFSVYPNPSCEETYFTFSLSQNSHVDLSIYDMEGHLITRLIEEQLKEGTHSIKWRRLDTTGKSCKPGALIAYLKVNGQIFRSLKLLII